MRESIPAWRINQGGGQTFAFNLFKCSDIIMTICNNVAVHLTTASNLLLQIEAVSDHLRKVFQPCLFSEHHRTLPEHVLEAEVNETQSWIPISSSTAGFLQDYELIPVTTNYPLTPGWVGGFTILLQ